MASSPPSTDWLSRMFEEHGRALLRFVGSRVRDPLEAEDIAQDTWLRLHRLEAPSRLDNARAFLFQTAANLVIDRQRRRLLEHRHLQQESQAADVLAPVAASAEQEANSASELQLVLAAIDELPLNCRQAFLMHRGRGMSYAEIAKALGVSTSMVEKHVIHALKHCRTRLLAAG